MFADNSTVVGLISNSEETHYGTTGEPLITLPPTHQDGPLTINGAAVATITFLGVHILEDLSCAISQI